jgi:hypothetical protein
LWGLSACSSFPTERVLFERQGVRVGVETDPSIRRAQTPVQNSHPAHLTPVDVERLLGLVQVSGWSGTLIGVLENPRPIPAFSEEELDLLAMPVTQAFAQATPAERVFFYVYNSRKKASDDSITGSLFIRGRYLHIVLTDHAEFARADTGGGDEKDPRDNKGMKLWISRPARAAIVPDAEEPRWAPFETVHISLNVEEVLASIRGDGAAFSHTLPSSEVVPPTGELRLQIQELTHSNLELRGHVEDQQRTIEELRNELTRLRQELESRPARPRKSRPAAP